MDDTASISRRSLFGMIGTVAGSAAMYMAMSELGHAEETSGYSGPIKLDGDPKGASVLVLGAGLAGMAAAYELRNAGYKVQVLEYQDRAGGRNWSIRRGDIIREIDSVQRCEFDEGLYINPGPWRIPYHHHAIIDYCRRFGVALEPFIQVNHNAYVHNSKYYGGKPQRFREVQADFAGHVSELLGKATRQGKLDDAVSTEDREILLEALRRWGALDKDYQYLRSAQTAERRGYDLTTGGGDVPPPIPSQPVSLHDLLQSGMWSAMASGYGFNVQTTIFQPVGGMGRIGDAFKREIGPGIIKYNCRVTEIDQDDGGVTVTYVDPIKGGPAQTARADWCVNTIPAPVLTRMPIKVSPAMRQAIDAVAGYEPNFKAGLQFKRRFWEQDEHIFGGITYTDLPIASIGYPNTDYATKGKGVLLGAYMGRGPDSYEIGSLPPEERIRRIVEWGAQIHPQYRDEFETGVSVSWHRMPWIMGCLHNWPEEKRAQYYDALIAFEGRMLLAGEHISYSIWQEHAILSGLSAVKRIHQRVMAA